jgi:hypothetical protein
LSFCNGGVNRFLLQSSMLPFIEYVVLFVAYSFLNFVKFLDISSKHNFARLNFTDVFVLFIPIIVALSSGL